MITPDLLVLEAAVIVLLLVGAPADQVAAASELIRQHSPSPFDPRLERATVIVLKTDRCEHF